MAIIERSLKEVISTVNIENYNLGRRLKMCSLGETYGIVKYILESASRQRSSLAMDKMNNGDKFLILGWKWLIIIMNCVPMEAFFIYLLSHHKIKIKVDIYSGSIESKK